MAVSLVKGGNVSLSKEAPGLTSVTVGLGWDVRKTDGQAFDLDAAAFILGENEKVISDGHFVFYNNKTSPDGSVEHGGDNRTGEGDGDDESIKIDFAKLPADVKKVVIAVTIHEAKERGQNFGSVSNAFARVVNDADGKELARFDLSEDSSTNGAMIFVELYRGAAGDIKVKAVGEGWENGLAGLAGAMGVNLG
ncbi:MAG: TerD family protein [Novosphingobium sp.]|uniref:TerD family protein n=1 Tax=unclassified Novosphingobium TaxID=2644732 RepID=UPI0012C3AB98|nr:MULTISPECIES: TerD family protein [unclassified Novosphingobium]MPS67211.1 TerD family protein [Novosphingobium sp.]GFE77324.1 tellurium resistance protein TerE [Novosphingobium sp. TCA1]